MKRSKYLAPGTEIVVDYIRFGFVDQMMNDNEAQVRLAVHNWPFPDLEIRNVKEIQALELTPLCEQYEEALL